MQWRTMFGNGLLAFSKYSDSSLHCMHCNITLILHILYYDLRIFHCHPGGHIAIEHNVSMTLININNMHRYYEWVSERVREGGTPVPRQHEHDRWVYISTTKLLIIIIIIINTMASTDGRQCLTHHSVLTSHHHASKTGGTKRWATVGRDAEYVKIRYAAAVQCHRRYRSRVVRYKRSALVGVGWQFAVIRFVWIM